MASTKPTTLQDIATRIGVNVSTVSLALRDNPRISAARRAEIGALARQLKYRVNTHAATLAQLKHRSSPITSALAWINDWPEPEKLRQYKEFDAYWQGAFASTEMRGYRLEEFRWQDGSGIKWLKKVLKSRGIQGALIMPPFQGLAHDWSPLLASELTVVKFGFPGPDHPFRYVVVSDHASNSRMAFQKMEELGYRRIGFVTRVGDINHNALRAGYLIGQLNSKQVAPLRPLALSWGGEAANRRELDGWLRRQKPDAIFTNIADLKAMLLSLKKRVPRDLGLAGTSVLDTNTNAGIDPQSYFVGKAAAEWLISLLQHYDQSAPRPFSQLLVAGRWVNGSDLPARKA